MRQRRAYRRVLCGWLIAVLTATTAAAQIRIEGRVRGADDRPVAGVQVRLAASGIVPSPRTVTDALGRYAFDKVPVGMFVFVEVWQNGRPVGRTAALTSHDGQIIDVRSTADENRLDTVTDFDPMEGPSGLVAGVIRGPDGAPVVAARVTLGATLSTTTDSTGRYSFGRVRAGITAELTIDASGFASTTRELTVVDDAPNVTDVVLTSGATIPRADLDPLERPGNTTGRVLQSAQVTGLPALARGDVTRALSLLPSNTTGAPEDGSWLVLAGAAPGETTVRYNGFTWYAMPTLSSAWAAFDPNTAGQARTETLVGTEISRGLGGALVLDSAVNRTGRPHGTVDVGALGASARVSVPLARRGSLDVGGRRSAPAGLFDDVLNAFAGGGSPPRRDRALEYSSGPLTTPEPPGYAELHGRLDLQITQRDRVMAAFYQGEDRANLSYDTPVSMSTAVSVPPAVVLPTAMTAAVGQGYDWNGSGASVSWQRRWSSAFETDISWAESNFTRLGDESSRLLETSTGIDYSFVAGRGGSGAWSESNRIDDRTVRGTATVHAGLAHAVKAGVEVSEIESGFTARYEVATPSIETTTSTLVPVVDRSVAARVVTAFAEDAWRPLPRLVVTPGVRVSHSDAADTTAVDPRVEAAYEAGYGVRLTGGWALSHQFVTNLTHENRLRGDTRFWTIADDVLVPVARVQQAQVGLSVDGPGVRFEASTFYRDLDDVSLLAPRLLPGVAPAARDRLFHQGTGTAAGGGIGVRHQYARHRLWVSYSGARVRYDLPTLEAGDFAATYLPAHEFRVAESVQLLRRLSAGASWIAASGRPYTTATGVGNVWFPTGAAIYQVTFGAKNDGRRPSYHRLDLTAEFDMRLGGVAFLVGGAAFNVYDRRNVSGQDYEAASQTLTVADLGWMGRAYNVFARFAF